MYGEFVDCVYSGILFNYVILANLGILVSLLANMVILDIWLFLANPLVLLQHHLRSVRNTFLGLHATLF